MFGLNRYDQGCAVEGKITTAPATLSEQLEQQYNYHLMKAAEIKAVMDKMSPEIKDFMEAWYRINR